MQKRAREREERNGIIQDEVKSEENDDKSSSLSSFSSALVQDICCILMCSSFSLSLPSLLIPPLWIKNRKILSIDG